MSALRPASRGGNLVPPTGGGGRPPPTASGKQVSAPFGMRPPTNAGRQATQAPLGMRPPSQAGRVPTANPNGPAAAMATLRTDVDVSIRPLTSGGLGGMKMSGQGPSRQIADKTYYMGELRNKLNDITNQLNGMKAEIEKQGKDNVTYGNLERKFESMMKDVRVLEGQLADFNLALDKIRTNTPLAEIQDMYERLKSRNDHDRKGVDDVFLKAANQEKSTKDIEDRISALHEQALERIQALGEDKHQEYMELQDELNIINARINERETQLQTIERETSQYEDTMKSDAYRIYQRGVGLRKEQQQLQRQHDELSDELNSQLSPNEIREKLTQKIKDETAEVNEMEKQIKDLEKHVENLQDTIRDKENQVLEAKKHASKSAKYDAIYERDAKMQEFLDSYPEIKAVESDNKAKLRSVIVELLKHISKNLNMSSQFSSGDSEKLNEMKSELSFKEEKMKNSQDTVATLQADLAKRRDELDKINTLDTKITAELAQLKQRQIEMEKEMTEFKSEEELRVQSNEQKKALLVDNQKMKKQREAIKQQVSISSSEFEKRNKELQNNDIMKRIDSLEQKLRTYAQTVFTLQEYIWSRKRESDYESLVRECNEITQQINAILISQQQ